MQDLERFKVQSQVFGHLKICCQMKPPVSKGISDLIHHKLWITENDYFSHIKVFAHSEAGNQSLVFSLIIRDRKFIFECSRYPFSDWVLQYYPSSGVSLVAGLVGEHRPGLTLPLWGIIVLFFTQGFTWYRIRTDEFQDKVRNRLFFYGSSRLILDVEFTQFDWPFGQSSWPLRILQDFLKWGFSMHKNSVQLKIRSQLSSCYY